MPAKIGRCPFSRFDRNFNSGKKNKLTVFWAESCFFVASDAGAVAGVLGDVVDGLLPDVGRGPVVADEEVLVVLAEAAVVELDPAATANKCGFF